MSVSSKMTAIADKIRALLGISGTMGLDAMDTNLGTEQTNVANAFTAVGSKGGTVPASQISGNLAEAINSIPEGVTVQRTSGSFTTSTSGTATVNCGFKPDVIIITGILWENKYAYQCGVCFPELTSSSHEASGMGFSGSYQYGVDFTFAQASTGFSAEVIKYDANWDDSVVSRKSFNYVAIKYTA